MVGTASAQRCRKSRVTGLGSEPDTFLQAGAIGTNTCCPQPGEGWPGEQTKTKEQGAAPDPAARSALFPAPLCACALPPPLWLLTLVGERGNATTYNHQKQLNKTPFSSLNPDLDQPPFLPPSQSPLGFQPLRAPTTWVECCALRLRESTLVPSCVL